MLFVGAQDRGFWVRETAQIRNEELKYIEEELNISKQINAILSQSVDVIIFDIDQYIDPVKEVAQEIMRIKRAKNCKIIIYAPGYDRESRVIKELLYQGICFFVFSGNMMEARQELERCLEGYFKDIPEEKKEEEVQSITEHTKIGITGVCKRIGTTTFAIQFVKHLQLKGYKACYIETNSTNFVVEHGKYFNIHEHDKDMGKVTYEGVDMFYKQEHIADVLKLPYDFFIYDFGTYTDTDFNKTSFLEKDIRIIMAGSKASEMKYTNEIIQNEFYTDVNYVFNFISKQEQPELLEFMEEKAEKTFFAVYSPDQFEYAPNNAFDKILPVKRKKEENTKSHKKFGFRKRKR